MIKVYDDVLPKKIVQDLEHLFSNTPVKFVFAPGTVDQDQVEGITEHKNIVDTPQIVHMVYGGNRAESEYWPDIKSLLYFIEDRVGIDIIGIDRVKANILTPHPKAHKNSFNMPHTDRYVDHQGLNWYSLVYYINDSDGDTFLFEQYAGETLDADRIAKRVPPRKGSFVIFDSTRWHASSNPSKGHRMILNFVLATKEKIIES